jgi:hypothetical protein
LGVRHGVKLLQLFYSNPNRSFYVREITRKIDEQINSVRRELANLLSIGIISSDNNNNKLYYEVNQKYEFYKPLAEIFSSGHLAAADAPTRDARAKEIASLGNVDAAVLTGYFTKDNSCGVDVLVIGDVNLTQLEKYVAKLEQEEGVELRYATFPEREFGYRQQVNDRFLMLLLDAKKQVIIDKNNRFSGENDITQQANEK